MSASDFDLRYDANGVVADLVVEARISHSPRANDSKFDPRPGDWLVVGDDEEPQSGRESCGETGIVCGSNST